SSAVVGAYALAVLAIGSVDATTTPGLLLVGAAALAAASGRRIVQGAVDRWLFGHRGDPYAVVSRVGRHLAPAAEPQEALDLLVEALRRALRLPYVAFVDLDAAIVVFSGEPVGEVETVPARALGQQQGELHVGRRRQGELFGAEEHDAIREVAERAGTLAYARRLVSDVADSRARIVVAREEERRRLRDDLHDELGPTLAGAAHQLESLASRLQKAGDQVGAERAAALRDRMRITIGDVRRIVHGLRPPVLDQLGLGAALESLLDGIDTPRCEHAIDLPRQLPAAVEVAAYAIGAEAVSNALRHSAGSQLCVEARLVDDGSWLVLAVSDNGQGVRARSTRGVGLRSMSERALEVGGTLEIGTAASGGTQITARLPIGAS
ncbi:MAG: histidine kinase, partial [Nocardioides sp.]